MMNCDPESADYQNIESGSFQISQAGIFQNIEKQLGTFFQLLMVQLSAETV